MKQNTIDSLEIVTSLAAKLSDPADPVSCLFLLRRIGFNGRRGGRRGEEGGGGTLKSWRIF